MPSKIKFGNAGGFGVDGTDDAENFDAPENVLRVSYICLGAGGGGGPAGGGDPHGGGGGGGGLSKGTLKVDPFEKIRVRAGGGGGASTDVGSGSTDGKDGQDSFVRTSYGERSGNGGKGGGTFGGGNGGNGNESDGQNGEGPGLYFGPGARFSRGGGAAKLGGNSGRVNVLGSGGKGTSFNFSTTAFTTSETNNNGANGGSYGGGGSGRVEALCDLGDTEVYRESCEGTGGTVFPGYAPGGGGGGIAFVGWVVLTCPKTILRSGEPVTITFSDSLNNSGTVTTSFTNDSQTNQIEEYVYTDNLGAESKITFTILPKVRITSLIASPNPQTSGSDGIPNYNTFLIWEGISVLSAVATRDDSAVSATWEEKAQPTDPALPPVFYGAGSKSVTNLFQSVSTGSAQPGSDTTYTLTATDGFNTATATVKVKAYNDNCPDNFTIADQLGKEPNETINISTSPIVGIDMVTTVVCSPGLTVLGSGGSGFTTSTTITSGSTLSLRVTTEPFNTDERGLVNEKTVSVTVGCLTVSFLVQTRAPVVEEIFDFGDNQFAYPFPKLDTRVVGEPLDDGGTYQQPQPYLQSPTIVEPSADAWEVELESPFGVQIKAKDILSSPANTTSYTDISSQNDTKLEVNNRRQGEQPNNTWTKPNII